MSDAIEILAVGLSVALVFSLPFAFVAFLRYMRYKERIALAEQGIAPQQPARTTEGVSGLLRWGIIISAVGMALSCALFSGLLTLFVSSSRGGPGSVFLIVPLIFIVLLPVFFGGALILINRLNRQAAERAVPVEKMG